MGARAAKHALLGFHIFQRATSWAAATSCACQTTARMSDTCRGLCRVQQEAELRPKRAKVQELEETVLVLTQELEQVTKERQALDAAQEKARAEALEALTEHGQVTPLLTRTAHDPQTLVVLTPGSR